MARRREDTAQEAAANRVWLAPSVMLAGTTVQWLGAPPGHTLRLGAGGAHAGRGPAVVQPRAPAITFFMDGSAGTKLREDSLANTFAVPCL